jgi:hypothetical protein
MSYLGNPIQSVAFLTNQFSGNGSTTAFTLSVAPATSSSLLVSISGVLQDPSVYSINGTTITFSGAPPAGTGNISVRYLGIPAAAVATTAYRTVTEFTATAGQTTFSPPSYTIGYIAVYLNGVRLASDDFTASNGTIVVLAVGASIGDSVVTESFYVSSVLNALPTTGGTISGNLNVTGTEIVGNAGALGGATNPIVGMTANANNYVQAYVINRNTSSGASADFCAYPDNGLDTSGWVDMGITSSTFNSSAYSVTGPNESYLFASAPSGANKTGNLVLATDSTGTANNIQFYNGGFNKAKGAQSATISVNGLGLGSAVASSGVGIAFPATQNPSSDANTLDDYEEGTWTPVMTAATGTITSQTTSGNYIKVGRLVTITFNAQLLTGTATAISQLTGLPFVISTTTPIGASREWFASGNMWEIIGNTGASTCSMIRYDNSSVCNAQFAWNGTLSYITNN